MKRKVRIGIRHFLTAGLFISFAPSNAQSFEEIPLGEDFYEVQANAREYFREHPDNLPDGPYQKYKRWESFWSSRVQKIGDANGSFDHLYNALEEYLSLGSYCNSEDPADWKLLGPKSLPNNQMGLVMSIYVDPSNDQFIIAGTKQGGLWRRTADNQSWENLTDKLHMPYMNVRSVSVEPGTNNQTIYFAAYAGHSLLQKRNNRAMGVFKTTDGGQTWTNIMPPGGLTDYAQTVTLYMDPVNPKTLYILYSYPKPGCSAENCSVYFVKKSTDGGDTWLTDMAFPGEQDANGEGLHKVFIMPGYPDYVFVTSGNKLWRHSLTEGWKDISVNLPNITTNSANWKRINIASKGNKLYCVYSDAQLKTAISISTDFGNTFTSKLVTSTAADLEKFIVPSKISDELYIGCPQRLFYKTTNGITGLQLKTGSYPYGLYNGTYTHCDYRDAYITLNSAGTDDELILANDGGLLKTTDGCSTYTHITGDLPTLNTIGLSTCESDPNYIMTGAWDNGIYGYQSGSWSLKSTPCDGISIKIDEQNKNYSYYVYGSGSTSMGIINSGTNSSSTMSTPSNAGLEFKPLKQHGSSIYVGAHDLFIGNSQTATPTWSNLTSSFNTGHTLGITDFCLASNDKNIIYVLYQEPAWEPTGGVRLIRTKDGGVNWTNISALVKIGNESAFQWLGGSSIIMNPSNNKELWIGLAGYSEGQKIYHTLDGGDTWTNISEGLPNFPVNCLEVYVCNGKPVLFAGTDAGVYFMPQGQLWQCFNNGLPVGIIMDLEITHSVNKLRASCFGRGIYETDLSIVNPIAPDVWSKDVAEDVGEEPGPGEVLWVSDDIWVRISDDNGTVHQNPEYRTNTANPNFVHVRVRNRGCSPYSGGDALKLYWAKASTSLGWPAPWDGSVTDPVLMGNPIGQQNIPAISAGGSVILKFPWMPPNPADYVNVAEKQHFCLLSRIETESVFPYGMSSPETSNLYTNVKNNNNIVWKNVTVVDDAIGDLLSGTGHVLIGNTDEEQIIARFDFSQRTKSTDQFLNGGLQVRLRVGTPFIEKWIEGGLHGEGVTLSVGGFIDINSPEAWIGNISLDPDDLYDAEFSFTPISIEGTDGQVGGRMANSAPRIFDVIQSNSDGTKNGERFLINLQKKSSSIPVKGLSKKQQKPCLDDIENCAAFKAEQEIILHPNPAFSSVRVSHPVPLSGAAVVSLKDILGRELFKAETLNAATLIPLQEIKPGIYFVSYRSGDIFISKRLIVITK